MQQRLKSIYGRLRGRPVVGMLASRTVWAVKGALGHPPVAAPAEPPPRRATKPPASDIRLTLALTAAQTLWDRGQAQDETPRRSPPTRSAEPPRSVSVIVSTLDRAAWLDRALRALAYQRHEALEVIVVAGPCRDQTDEVLARHAGRVRVARCPAANLSLSRNIGLALARGEVVAFLDDDAVPEPDWVERLLEGFQDPAVGGVGGAIRDHTGLAFQCRVTTSDRFARTAQHEGLRGLALEPPGPEVERFLSLTGANCAFRRDALVGIGGFDEAYAYFLEETDACLRLAQDGWRLATALDAEVHHAYAPNAQRQADRTPRSLWACVRSTAYFAVRNGAPRHGMAATVDHLHAYADGLRRDTLWRRDHGRILEPDAARMLEEIDRGLADGVRAALGAPRRLLLRPAPAAKPLEPKSPAIRRAGDRLKLCLLSQDYPSPAAAERPVGGVAVWTQALAEAMAAAGHEVTVITRTTEAAAVTFESAPGGGGVWLHRIRREPAARPLRPPSLLNGLPASVADPALAAAAEVARIMPRRRFDLVLGPLWDLEPAALLNRAGCPVGVSLHTACAQMPIWKPQWDDAYRRGHVDRVIAGERRLLASAPAVLANSRAAARDIAAVHDLPELAARATVVPHGLPDLARGVEPAPRRHGVEILFVGRLETRKGADVLLDAAARVLRAVPDAGLTLVGEEVGEGVEAAWRGRLATEGQAAAWSRRVRFEGPLRRAELLARYAAADLVAVPSRYESFGLTALEAMIFAKPCVASDAGGLGEVVAHGETGLLVAPGDPDALAQALLRLVRDPALRLAMGEAARRRYEARFTAAAMACAFETWAWSVVEGRRRLAAE